MNKPAKISKLRVLHMHRNMDAAGPGVNQFRQRCIAPTGHSYLSISTAEGIYLLGQHEITRCTAQNNYCIIHYGNGKKLLSSKTLKAVQSHLDDVYFIRTHQSHVIRLSEIRLVQKERVILKNGDSLPISRKQRPELMNRISLLANQI